MPGDGDDALVVNRTVRVPRRDLDVRFSPSGGPGGQHANRSATRVELRLDLTSCGGLSDQQRRRVIGRLGAELRVVADDERSQTRNRALAEQRLAARLAEALRVERPRRATRPTRGAVERRISTKKRRSEMKKLRRRPDEPSG